MPDLVVLFLFLEGGKDSQVNMIGENPKVQADGICKLSAWITVLGDAKARSRQVRRVLE